MERVVEALACFYHVSNLKMFKTAFPPGWIGKHKKITCEFKDQMWIEKEDRFKFHHNELTAREASLASALQYQGNWQSELIKSGFNFNLINSMVSKNLLVKTKKKNNKK